MSQIVIKNVTKTYRRGPSEAEVLSDVSISINSGEFLAIMGPSGSGKTTLLNIIGGLDLPNSGEVIIGGERIDGMNAEDLGLWRHRNVGYVFQFYNLMPGLSAQANVELPLVLTRLSRAQRRRHAEIALELVGALPAASHKPYELSGGQQQRIAIARAIVADPGILVCDEPTGDLDRKSAEEIIQLLLCLSQSFGKTVVMVTHDTKAAESATRRVILDKGQLIEAA
jgi:putative ABC transport system ATP-binding protein